MEVKGDSPIHEQLRSQQTMPLSSLGESVVERIRTFCSEHLCKLESPPPVLDKKSLESKVIEFASSYQRLSELVTNSEKENLEKKSQLEGELTTLRDVRKELSPKMKSLDQQIAAKEATLAKVNKKLENLATIKQILGPGSIELFPRSFSENIETEGEKDANDQ